MEDNLKHVYEVRIGLTLIFGGQKKETEYNWKFIFVRFAKCLHNSLEHNLNIIKGIHYSYLANYNKNPLHFDSIYWIIIRNTFHKWITCVKIFSWWLYSHLNWNIHYPLCDISHWWWSSIWNWDVKVLFWYNVIKWVNVGLW